jgi:c-di-GMP-binding flagellar brake protein YcgR
MDLTNGSILIEAIDRNLPAILSLPSAGLVRNYKSRLVGDLDGGFLLQAPANETTLIEQLIRAQTPCAIALRSGILKLTFATTIRRFEPAWKMNSELIVDALLLEFPRRIEAAQKRHDYRVEIPHNTDIALRVWRMGPQDDLKAEPNAAAEVKAAIRDLSAGGAGVTFHGQDGQLPRVCVEDRLRVELKYNGQPMILEAQMRAPNGEPQKDKIITGIQFKKLQDDLEGRQNLAQLVRIVGELQRVECQQRVLA